MRKALLITAIAFSTSVAVAGDPDQRLKANLQDRGVTCDLEGLVGALRGSESGEVRAMAAEYLSMRPDPDAWETLAHAAKGDPDALVRAQAVNALLAIDCKKAESLAETSFEAAEDGFAKEVLAYCGRDFDAGRRELPERRDGRDQRHGD